MSVHEGDATYLFAQKMQGLIAVLDRAGNV